MVIAQALAAAAASGLERLDAQLLLLHALGRPQTDRAWLLAHDDDELPAGPGRAFVASCERRAGGEPLAYIVGRKEFHGLDLCVDARVLVPRPDTETLVDWAISLLRDRDAPSVIDLGTGSGAIALAIGRACPDAHVTAVDTSPAALELARDNARELGVRVLFLRSSWLAGAPGPYDMIVSNPPYVAEGDPHLAALRYEPRDALVAGPDGLRDIRMIVRQAASRLRPGGWLLFEHGWDQAAAVRALLEAAGFRSVTSRRDLAGIERCSGGAWRELG